MARTVFDVISPPTAFDRLPITVIQVASPSTGATRLLLLLPAIGALSTLLTGVAIAAVAEPGMLDAVARRPLASIQIAFGLVIWAALFVVPASRAIAAIGRRREVSIVDDVVEIKDRSLLGTRSRGARVGDYRGITHHIRASLSGLTHEIVLVHSNPSLTVTLLSADRVTQGMLDEAKTLLQLRELPPGTIYERHTNSGSTHARALEPVPA